MIAIGVAIIAVVAHECGHALTAVALGVRVKGISISRRGIGVVREASTPINNALIAAAGPMMNILLVAIFWQSMGLPNVLLAALNLIPVAHSDGRRILDAFQYRRVA